MAYFQEHGVLIVVQTEIDEWQDMCMNLFQVHACDGLARGCMKLLVQCWTGCNKNGEIIE